MASIRKEIVTSARPEAVWDAIRDIGVHVRPLEAIHGTPILDIKPVLGDER